MDKAQKSIENYLESKGVILSKIQFLEDIKENKQDSFWFAGPVVHIFPESKNEHSYVEIRAVGDVDLSLFDAKLEDSILRIRDHSGNMEFRKEIDAYIDNDKELHEALAFKHAKYTAIPENNNWWEAFCMDDGVYYELDWCLSADKITDAIIEVYSALGKIFPGRR